MKYSTIFLLLVALVFYGFTPSNEQLQQFGVVPLTVQPQLYQVRQPVPDIIIYGVSPALSYTPITQHALAKPTAVQYTPQHKDVSEATEQATQRATKAAGASSVESQRSLGFKTSTSKQKRKSEKSPYPKTAALPIERVGTVAEPEIRPSEVATVPDFTTWAVGEQLFGLSYAPGAASGPPVTLKDCKDTELRVIYYLLYNQIEEERKKLLKIISPKNRRLLNPKVYDYYEGRYGLGRGAFISSDSTLYLADFFLRVF